QFPVAGDWPGSFDPDCFAPASHSSRLLVVSAPRRGCPALGASSFCRNVQRHPVGRTYHQSTLALGCDLLGSIFRRRLEPDVFIAGNLHCRNIRAVVDLDASNGSRCAPLKPVDHPGGSIWKQQLVIPSADVCLSSFCSDGSDFVAMAKRKYKIHVDIARSRSFMGKSARFLFADIRPGRSRSGLWKRRPEKTDHLWRLILHRNADHSIRLYIMGFPVSIIHHLSTGRRHDRVVPSHKFGLANEYILCLDTGLLSSCIILLKAVDAFGMGLVAGSVVDVFLRHSIRNLGHLRSGRLWRLFARRLEDVLAGSPNRN